MALTLRTAKGWTSAVLPELGWMQQLRPEDAMERIKYWKNMDRACIAYAQRTIHRYLDWIDEGYELEAYDQRAIETAQLIRARAEGSLSYLVKLEGALNGTS